MFYHFQAEELMQWSLSMWPKRGWPGEDSTVGRLSQDLAGRNLMPPPGGPSAPATAAAASASAPVPIITEPPKRLRRSSTEEAPTEVAAEASAEGSENDVLAQPIGPPPAKKICV